ncbi:MAG: hypothetical protein QOJ34_1673, partial [Pseudonocardiales bacterium]|nr:hypothetical protein [Pseudonocardiales bacterium]
PHPAASRPRGLGRIRGWPVLIAGLIVAAIAFFMLRSGNQHLSDYNDFQDCIASGSTPICVLYDDGSQADGSASAFKSNADNQILIGTIGLGVAGLLLVVGAVLLVSRRKTERAAGVTRQTGSGASH